jgi:hypothetical protein
MNGWRKTFLLASAVVAVTASASLVGCGDDDQGVVPTDAGSQTDVVVPPGPDGSTTDANTPDAKVDGGACDFAEFVTGLIKNQTTPTALPSTDLGQACTDKKDPTQFAPLFP